MSTNQKIIPNLWFDHTLEEALDFYTSIFPGSSVANIERYPNSQDEGLADFQVEFAGKPLSAEFVLAGNPFVGINAGSEFSPTPANSTTVYFDSKEDPDAKAHMDQVWEKLSEGGSVLMPLQAYDYSEYYGWVQDKFGYSWQLMYLDANADKRTCMVPSLMFGGEVQNRAKEAVDYYLEVFNNSQAGTLAPYGEANEIVTKDSLMYADFKLEDQWFIAMDSGVKQDFSFTEAVSYAVMCEDQAEIDYYWEKLSAHPENEQCGWCKDKFGVSWQIVPKNMNELMKRPDAFKKMMDMKKLVIADF